MKKQILLIFVLLVGVTVCTAQGPGNPTTPPGKAGKSMSLPGRIHHSPLAGFSILLDPGHGGTDSGAVGPTGLYESETNLRVAKYLKMLLEFDGAKVEMTRNSDVALTLQERVDLATQLKPDLFVSIHHNASVRKNVSNRGEIYFNALDEGIPLRVAEEISSRIPQSRVGSVSVVLPGGYYVLRNNPAPAILTEASYISVPEIEKTLRCGRALTDEAQVFRSAIREALAKAPLKVQVYGKSPIFVNTPYMNLLFSAEKSISKLTIKTDPPIKAGFSFDRMPSFGFHYSLYNTAPLQSGDYSLKVHFHGQDGSISPAMNIPVKVELPLKQCALVPVAPYVPKGFAGRFPLALVLKDDEGRVNKRAVPLTAVLGGKRIEFLTRNDGKGVFHLDLDGSEEGPFEITVKKQDETIARTYVPVKVLEKNFVLGSVVSSQTGEGIEKARVRYSGKSSTPTFPGGFFFLEFPPIFGNISLKIQPPPGFPATDLVLKTGFGRVIQPRISIAPNAPTLLGKEIGLMAPRKLDPWVRPLVKEMMKCGIRIHRLGFQQDPKPEIKAVRKANEIRALDLLLSFREEDVKQFSIRHYHRSPKGKAVAEALSSTIGKALGTIPPISMGGDYELGNTNAVALVFSLPRQTPPEVPGKLASNLVEGLKQALK